MQKNGDARGLPIGKARVNRTASGVLVHLTRVTGCPAKALPLLGGTAGMLSVAMRSRLQLGNRTTELDITCLHGGIVERLAERVREATMFVGVPLGLTQNEVRA
jgi:hypothetical protein